MIANRPDWTLSRQRQWGVPMAFFVHKETGELHPRTPELMEQVAQRIEQHSIEAWQSLDPAELLGDEASQYEKNRDTLDVWFDSGTTHATVLGGQEIGSAHVCTPVTNAQLVSRLLLDKTNNHYKYPHI